MTITAAPGALKDAFITPGALKDAFSAFGAGRG
ncbi:hypothetical protein CLV71_107192 [Actinophytocola oryzae]|uniref:Uncharacterized protein n=1 Tax=Actinophytocola oryzae TaxID=502181 RepID=A0A4R7VK58_9PSEU|nr:hypothetical protein CLV71_107192 [Actinophytocola oryzae]